MRRHPDLQLLSEDHHHALVLARRATLAAVGQGRCSATEQWAEVLRSFNGVIGAHFEIEERLLVPSLEAAGEHALAARVLEDHAALRRCVTGSIGTVESRLAELGRMLEAHVRFEERELFEVAQAKLDRSVLRAVAAASAAVPRG